MSHDLFPYRVSHHAAARWVERMPGVDIHAAYRRAILTADDPHGGRQLSDPESGARFVVTYGPRFRAWVIVTTYLHQAPLPTNARKAAARARRNGRHRDRARYIAA